VDALAKGREVFEAWACERVVDSSRLGVADELGTLK
jgi:hypothetical protein